MHSNLTPYIAHQRVADLHEQAAKYRSQHPAQPTQQQQPEPQPVQRHLNLLRLATQSVHHRRTA